MPPLYCLGRTIAAAWPSPHPQARAYLKAFHYLVGMDDCCGSAAAPEIIRLFLLFSRAWTGPVARQMKADLLQMKQELPTSEALLAQLVPCPSPALGPAPASLCVVCQTSLEGMSKFVSGRTTWGAAGPMCVSCNYFQGEGLQRGNGALYFRLACGSWLYLYGDAEGVVEPLVDGAGGLEQKVRAATEQKVDYSERALQRWRRLGGRVARVVRRLKKAARSCLPGS